MEYAFCQENESGNVIEVLMLDWGHTGYALFLYRFLPRGGEAEGGRIFENLQAQSGGSDGWRK